MVINTPENKQTEVAIHTMVAENKKEVTETAKSIGGTGGTGVKSTQSPSQGSEKKESMWIYPLLGSLFGLSLILLLAFFLWKRGYLALPFIISEDDEDHPHQQDRF